MFGFAPCAYHKRMVHSRILDHREKTKRLTESTYQVCFPLFVGVSTFWSLSPVSLSPQNRRHTTLLSQRRDLPSKKKGQRVRKLLNRSVRSVGVNFRNPANSWNTTNMMAWKTWIVPSFPFEIRKVLAGLTSLQLLYYTVDGSELPKQPTTVWMVLKNPANNGINYQPQLVSWDFFHQQYHEFFISTLQDRLLGLWGLLPAGCADFLWLGAHEVQIL